MHRTAPDLLLFLLAGGAFLVAAWGLRTARTAVKKRNGDSRTVAGSNRGGAAWPRGESTG